MTAPETLFQQVCQHARQTALLGSIEGVLGWDQRTMLPPRADAHRAEQMSLLAGMIHDRWADPRFGDALAELAGSPLAADPYGDQGATIRVLRRQRDKRVKLPKALVQELTRTAVLGEHAWVEARRNNDFASFRPLLEKMFHLKRQQAEAIGYEESPYDALLDDFEPEARSRDVAAVLAELRAALVPLVGEIVASPRQPRRDVLARCYPIAAQEEFGRRVARQVGFCFDRGRLDVTAHPFCSGMGPHDCRITTRYDEHNPCEALFGILHEAGHGMYEQGLREDQYGLPLGDSVSLGIHESQSRMWENLVGRSRAFWEHFYPLAQAAFPAALADVDRDAFHFAINLVEPSLIRTDADEATYNLHILIRFELEQAVLAGQLPVADLPAAWHQRYRDDLGVAAPTDADGVLQDIHWSAGLVGYFPTYSLGNLYAAQFFAAAERDLGSLESQFARGEFAPLRHWLNERIHQQGCRYPAAVLVHRVTGSPLSHEPLVRQLRAKYAALYGIAG